MPPVVGREAAEPDRPRRRQRRAQVRRQRCGSNGAGARSSPISVACTCAGSRAVNASPSSRSAAACTRSTSRARPSGSVSYQATTVLRDGSAITAGSRRRPCASSSSDRSTRGDEPGRGDRGGGQRGLPLAGLDQQAAARGQPARRGGGHPALDVEPVRAAVERHRGSWSRASGGISAMESVGTYGAFATTTATRPRSDGGQRRVEVALVHLPRDEVAARARDGGGVDVDGVQREPGHRRGERRGDRGRAAAQLDDDVAGPQERERRAGRAARCAAAARRRRGRRRCAARRTPPSPAGAPAARRRRGAATRAASSAGERAASTSRRASSSAKTQPAARRAATTSAGGRVGKGPTVPAQAGSVAPVLDAHRQTGSALRLEWGPTGAAAIGRGCDVAVVVDVLSFTTTVTVAADRGVERAALPLGRRRRGAGRRRGARRHARRRPVPRAARAR